MSRGKALLLLAAIAPLAGAQTPGPVAQDAALAPIATAVFPKARPLAVTVVPPASPLAAINMAKFPTPRPLSVTMAPPASPLAAINTAKFPTARPLMVTVERGEILTLATTVAGVVTPSVSSGPPSPEALAALATATFPTPQSLSVTLVPPPSQLSAIAAASFPATQPLSVTLAPGPTPLSAIAAAKFPAPAPLSVTLYAGEALTAATMLAGLAPTLTLGGQYTVQIVQVIPRRGAQFFDYRDPTGAGTVLVAGATTQTVSGAPPAGGGGPLGPVCVPPATPPLSADVCGTTLSLSDDGFPFGANLGPQGNRSMHLTPVGGAQIQIAAQTGITPNAVCPGLLCTTTQVFTPGAACDTVAILDTGTPKAPIVKFRRNGGQVCAQRLQ